MDKPSSKKAPSTLPNSAIGLSADNLAESDINLANWRFLQSMKESPKPKGTVGHCTIMRERILQLSLFPDIYDKRGRGSYGNSARD